MPRRGITPSGLRYSALVGWPALRILLPLLRQCDPFRVLVALAANPRPRGHALREGVERAGLVRVAPDALVDDMTEAIDPALLCFGRRRERHERQQEAAEGGKGKGAKHGASPYLIFALIYPLW